MLLSLASQAAIGQCLHAADGLFTVIERGNRQYLAIDCNSGNSLADLAPYAAYVQHTLAGDTDGIDLFAFKPMLCQKLIKAVGIAGLKEHEHPAFGLSRFLHKIF